MKPRRAFSYSIFITILLVMLFPIITRFWLSMYEIIDVIHDSHAPGAKGYLVWSDNCKIPDMDPYSPEVLKFFQRRMPITCRTSRDIPFTQVVFNSTAKKYVLLINKDEINYFSSKQKKKVDCCYEVIKGYSDDFVSCSYCFSLKEPVTLPVSTENIRVKCKNENELIHQTGYTMMPERNELRKRINDWKRKSTRSAINVIMLGIDSVSRVNLIRSMPQTAQYIYDNEWFEMSGYNKIGLNTFPNLMAILTGFNESTTNNRCNLHKWNGLEHCPFIWNAFKEHGYITAYAEDTSSISTFNYLSKGFKNPPVDYYFRPFIYAVQDEVFASKNCLGSKPTAFHVYDYALELDMRYRNDSYFGLFWTNFCHDDINQPTSMDDSMVFYLKNMAERGILDRSAIIFLSDHGMRYGPTRKTISGYYEDRLPFLFIWLPPWVRRSHTELANALGVNKNRLTCPYDLYVTLKHILELSGRAKNLPPAQDCPKCQSLLKVVPNNRSCADAAISENWCTCIPWTAINMRSDKVQKMLHFSVNYLNELVVSYKNGSLVDICSTYSLRDIISAQVRDKAPKSVTETHMIRFTTNPYGAAFEAVMLYFVKTEVIEVIDNIHRISIYRSSGDCVNDRIAKEICSCKG